MIDLLKSEEFEFWMPMSPAETINKAQKRQGPKDQNRWIEGTASTEHEDLQKETVYQRGIDFSYFIEFGYYNNDHKPGFENKVGEPTEAIVKPEGFWTRGFLYKNHKVADGIWELAHALEASNATRKLGFSIQGKVIRRAGRRILKCWVQDVAVTAAPINTHTWLDIAKSIAAVPEEMWCEGEHGVIYPAHSVRKAVPCDPNCGCKCKKSKRAISEEDIDLRKDVEVYPTRGYHGEDEDEKRDKKKRSEKALSTGTAGGALIPESLDSEAKVQTWGKSLNYDNCVELLQQHRGVSRSEAIVLTDAVFEMNGIIN